MTRTRWTIVTILATTLLVAACGGSAATAAPGGTSPAATPGAATAAPPTEGTGGIGIGGAAAKLENLSSYKFSIRMAAEGTAGFSLVTAGGSMTISGTVILKPEIAMDMTMASKDAAGAESAFGYRILKDKAYVSLGPDLWMETDADDAQSTVDSFKPENIMTGFGNVEDMQNAGDEDRNGIATTHYTGEAPAAVGSMFGLPTGTWTIEAWIARDGGYLVSSAVTGEAPDGKFVMSVDIRDLDSSGNKVEVPANFTPMGG
ncbi:MAG: LppX_LprAFG lipoprotein [Chloroflexota bacterium]|nr:LppX_LprAFG lipoprotein [Chloroflexota bacterium]